MTDVSVECEVKGQYDVLQSPPILPPIYNGEKLVLYVIIKPCDSFTDKVPVEGTAILRGKIPGKEICHSLPFMVNTTAKDPSPSTTVHHLAAKALIKDWQNERKSKDEIVKLSIEASVISAHTAFIAVDEESLERINAPMKIWDIRAAQAFKSLDNDSDNWGYALCSSDDDSECEALCDENSEPELPMLARSRIVADEDEVNTPFLFKEKKSVAQPTPPVSTPSKCLSNVVKAQQANGSWKLDSTLVQLLKKTAKQLEDGCPTEVKGSMAAIWATILVLSLLKKEFSSQQEEWELIAMKAESWLGKQALPSGVSKANLVAAADKLL